MIYNNLIYLLIVILLFTTTSVPESPNLPLVQALGFWLLKTVLYYQGAKRFSRPGRITTSRHYYGFERQFSILAILSFSVDLYFLDCKYYLAQMPLAAHLPLVVDAAGIGLFFVYLAIIWGVGRTSYQTTFGRSYSTRSFLISNLKNNLPIVLPWLILSLAADLLQLLPLPFWEKLPLSRWGDELLFLCFFLFLAVTFPALIKKLWGCTPLPAGPDRNHIETFCARQNFRYSDIMLWPLFEGQALTAGVMGIYHRLRYLLVTPALLNNLSPAEVEAVMAHEIGHAKKYHLQLYLLLFLGFALLVSQISNPILYLLLSSDQFYNLMNLFGRGPESGLAFWGTVPLFLIMILYFRYIFGFFMRNFERQADLYVFKAIGHSNTLISSLEKVGWLSGNIRDLPSWHHFGISQRVDFLNRCAADPRLIKRHDFKVFGILLLYVLVLAGSAAWLQAMPMESLADHSKNKFIEAVIRHRADREPQNPLWHRLLGDILQEKDQPALARQAYERTLELNPADAETLNNLAWLLITSTDPAGRDPYKALQLAKEAVRLAPEGFILDTLATAFWANGLPQTAEQVARQAIRRDPRNQLYYDSQINRFLTESYHDNLIFEEKSDSERFSPDPDNQ